ncbi:CDP-glucose 4,6-dehydratase [compost metagenome]
MLAENLYKHGEEFASAWNFGPNDTDTKPVKWIVEKICEKWGAAATYKIDNSPKPHEAHYLKLDCSKAISQLGWQPKWNLEETLDKILDWTTSYKNNKDLREICFKQIDEYFD